jgi:hypothetical protein
VPGGPWPHPVSSPLGHSHGAPRQAAEPVANDDWRASAAYLRAVELFNLGYYWEAHEVWEALWHAHGRRGPTADALKGLIKLSAAGLKVRQRQRHGIVTHARRAAEAFRRASDEGGNLRLGLDLASCEAVALAIAESPPADPAPAGATVSSVFAFRIEPC